MSGAPLALVRRVQSGILSSHKALVLAHFDATLPISLTVDASSYTVGAVISHTMPDGKECPIAFTSHTLSEAERKYAQVEKQVLSLVVGELESLSSGGPAQNQNQTYASGAGPQIKGPSMLRARESLPLTESSDEPLEVKVSLLGKNQR